MNTRSSLTVNALFVAITMAVGVPSVHALERSPDCNLKSKRTLNKGCAEWKQEVARSNQKEGSFEGRGGLDTHARMQENYAYSNCLRIQTSNGKPVARAQAFCANLKP